MGHEGQDIDRLIRDAMEQADELVQQVGYTCAESVPVTGEPMRSIESALLKIREKEKKVPSMKALMRMRDAAFDIAIAATWDMQVENALSTDEQKELAYHAIVTAKAMQDVLDACR